MDCRCLCGSWSPRIVCYPLEKCFVVSALNANRTLFYGRLVTIVARCSSQVKTHFLHITSWQAIFQENVFKLHFGCNYGNMLNVWCKRPNCRYRYELVYFTIGFDWHNNDAIVWSSSLYCTTFSSLSVQLVRRISLSIVHNNHIFIKSIWGIMQQHNVYK